MRIVHAIGGFFRFWYGFVVGDDWTVAAAIGAALVITATLNHNGIAAWWVVPLTVVVVTGSSLRRWAINGSKL